MAKAKNRNRSRAPERGAANALKRKAWRIRIALRCAPKHALVDMPLVEFCKYALRPRYLAAAPIRVELKELGNPLSKFVEVQ